MCSLKNIEKALVLLCFRSKRLKNQWFYCKISVEMQKSEKSIGFTMKMFKKVKKPFVVQWFFEKRGRKTNFQPRIRAVQLQYSSGDVMRNPYRQAV